jgi:small-conductance mechanosensitive channel
MRGTTKQEPDDKPEITVVEREDEITFSAPDPTTVAEAIALGENMAKAITEHMERRKPEGPVSIDLS